jgi:hypothetical protein
MLSFLPLECKLAFNKNSEIFHMFKATVKHEFFVALFVWDLSINTHCVVCLQKWFQCHDETCSLVLHTVTQHVCRIYSFCGWYSQPGDWTFVASISGRH